MRRRFAVAVVLVVTAGAAGVVDPARASTGEGVGSWRATGSLVGEHYTEQVVTLANGRVLDVIGYGETPAVELYDPASGAWAQAPAPPGGRVSTIVPLRDGGALAIGEVACSSPQYRCLPTPATYRLDPADRVWSAAAPMREARTRPTVVGLADGRVLVAGGFGDSCSATVAMGYSCAPLSSVEIFDPATGAWSSAASLPVPLGGAGATLLSDNTVLLVGGSSQTNDVLRYNPAAGSWTTLAPSPVGLTGTRLLALPGDRAIALGFDPEADFYGSYGGAGLRALLVCRSVPEIYSLKRESWGPAPPLPEEPISCSPNAVALTGGQVLYAASKARYVLDTHQQCWAMTGAPATQHYGLLAALPDGGALDVGGSLGKIGPSTETEIYAAARQACTAAQRIQTNVFDVLAPQGQAAKSTSVLAHRYSISLTMPQPGRLRVAWYYTRTENEGQPGQVLVAAGRARTTRTHRLKLTLKLTATGRELLERNESLILTAKGTFTDKRGRRVAATRPFTLTR